MSIKNKDIKLNDGTLKIIINAYEKCKNKELRELGISKNLCWFSQDTRRVFL